MAKSIGNMLSFVFHTCTFLFYVYVVYFDLTRVQGTLAGHRNYAGSWKFLTWWNECLQTAYFGYAVLNDVFGSNLKPRNNPLKRRKLQKTRDFVFNSIIFPLGTFVVLSFWGLYAVDRELVYPRALDKIIPVWMNHATHTTVLPLLLMEKFLVYHHMTSKVKSMMATVLFALSYQIWVFWIYFHAGFWVYPVLAVLAWPMKMVFLITLWVLMVIITMLGEWITQLIWKPNQVLHLEKHD